MTTIAFSPKRMTYSTQKLFDFMCDGQWHETKDIITTGSQICLQHEPQEAFHNGHRVRRTAIQKNLYRTHEELSTSGAKDLIKNRLRAAVNNNKLEKTSTHYRMPEDVCEAWKKHSLTYTPPPKNLPQKEPLKRTRKNNNKPETFGGLTEPQGWAEAPLQTQSRVHFHVENGHLNLDELKEKFPNIIKTTIDYNTGLHRLDCEYGTAEKLKENIIEWCEINQIIPKSIRIEKNLKRRNLDNLNQNFLAELCVWYSRYSQTRIKKHKSTLQYHFTEKDDVDQQLFEWILEAIARYDVNSGVPFGAFLSGRISQWVHDLNRSKYGRSGSDTELKYQRARQSFVAEHGRLPSENELAKHLNQDINVVRKNAQTVAVIQGLRNMTPLENQTEEYEIQIPDSGLVNDRHDDHLQQTLLSHILTKSCEPTPDLTGEKETKPNIIGFVTWYEKLWGTQTKTQLSKNLNISIKKITEHSERVEQHLKTHQHLLVNA